MNKIVYVEAFFKPVGKEVTREVPTGETKKGFLGFEKDVTKKVTKWEQTGYSKSEIDGQRLSADIELAVQQLNRDGYEVVSITPVVSGAFDFKYEVKFGGVNHGGGGYGYGYGYSYTEGVTIIAKRAAA
ncbi:hypothetical protein WJ41_12880 [Burkholderia ubonensis]|uniref:hypothetical protein n=1 Tax=Burkholderia ubonensis TaxID=101571 RepID=UPI00075626C5|nr:hypothetical protein [Burkholderia ubonensis]KVH72540.1 hypothetical protein WJ41_12880 [Burkholderia ubonensis]KVU02508.1 hypothetical protein WK61_36340 [Burkholderia ubonensis]